MCLFKDTVYIQCIIRMFYHAFNQTSHMRASMSLVTCFHDINLLAYHRNMICKYQHCLLHSLVLCHCDLIYRLNSFVSVTVCYRSMPVITYVINQSCIQCMLLIYDKCPPVMHLPSHARLNDQDGRYTPPTISAATCKIKSVVQLLLERCICIQLVLERCICFQLLLEKCRCLQLC